MKKLILTAIILLCIPGCSRGADEDSASYSPEEHPCTNMKDVTNLVYEAVTKAKIYPELEEILNILQAGVHKHPEFTILQSAAEYYFLNPDIGIDEKRFYEGVMKACQHRFGTIADRNNV